MELNGFYLFLLKLKNAFLKAVKRTTVKELAISLLIILTIFSLKEVFANYYGFSLNPTKSIEGNLFIYEKNAAFRAKKGDLLAFKIDGEDKFYPNKTLVKLVVGVEGDNIEVSGRKYVIGSTNIQAKEYSQTGERLEQFLPETLTIPKNSYFVMGTNPNSYDSRYIGFVTQSQVVGRVWVIF